MILLKWLIAAVAAFGGFVALAYVGQRSLLFHPDKSRTSPFQAGLPGVEEFVLDLADGEKVIVWYAPQRGDKPLVLYFHGNAGSLRGRADRFRALLGDGYGLVALSYRGYGGSTGSPSEAGLIADAQAAYAFATARAPAERIVVFGESLGTGVAVALAATQRIGRLVLEAPFTSAADVGAGAFWFLPVRLLMKDPFRSDLRIGKVTAPLLILHGVRDRVVPFVLGERLFALANEPKRFVRFDQGAHHDLDRHGAMDAVRQFIGSDAF
ncbi:MAG: alpha/beta hydrolase [Hyphomicrobiales bacterium]|nr:alpha/beta hydrolase [Alphaproteobacteria bacterium]